MDLIRQATKHYLSNFFAGIGIEAFEISDEPYSFSNLHIQPEILKSFGLPFNIGESKITNLDIKIDSGKVMVNANQASIKLLLSEITKEEKPANQGAQNIKFPLSIAVEDFTINVFQESFQIPVISLKIGKFLFDIDRTKTGIFSFIDTDIRISNEPLLTKQTFTFSMKPSSPFYCFEQQHDFLILKLSPNQLKQIYSLWTTFKSKNSKMSQFCMVIRKIIVQVSYGSKIEVDDLCISLSEMSMGFSATKIVINISSLLITLKNVTISSNDFIIEKFEARSTSINSLIVTVPEGRRFAVTTQIPGVRKPTEFNISFQPISISTSLATFMFYLTTLKTNHFFQFLLNLYRTQLNSKLTFPSISLEIKISKQHKITISSKSIQLNVNYSSAIFQYTFPDLQIKYDNQPINSPILIQYILHSKEEIRQPAIFISQLTLYLSFDIIHTFLDILKTIAKYDFYEFLKEEFRYDISLSKYTIYVGPSGPGGKIRNFIRILNDEHNLKLDLVSRLLSFKGVFEPSVQFYNPVTSYWDSLIEPIKITSLFTLLEKTILISFSLPKFTFNLSTIFLRQFNQAFTETRNKLNMLTHSADVQEDPIALLANETSFQLTVSDGTSENTIEILPNETKPYNKTKFNLIVPRGRTTCSADINLDAICSSVLILPGIFVQPSFSSNSRFVRFTSAFRIVNHLSIPIHVFRRPKRSQEHIADLDAHSSADFKVLMTESIVIVGPNFNHDMAPDFSLSKKAPEYSVFFDDKKWDCLITFEEPQNSDTHFIHIRPRFIFDNQLPFDFNLIVSHANSSFHQEVKPLSTNPLPLSYNPVDSIDIQLRFKETDSPRLSFQLPQVVNKKGNQTQEPFISRTVMQIPVSDNAISKGYMLTFDIVFEQNKNIPGSYLFTFSIPYIIINTLELPFMISSNGQPDVDSSCFILQPFSSSTVIKLPIFSYEGYPALVFNSPSPPYLSMPMSTSGIPLSHNGDYILPFPNQDDLCFTISVTLKKIQNTTIITLTDGFFIENKLDVPIDINIDAFTHFLIQPQMKLSLNVLHRDMCVGLTVDNFPSIPKIFIGNPSRIPLRVAQGIKERIIDFEVSKAVQNLILPTPQNRDSELLVFPKISELMGPKLITFKDQEFPGPILIVNNMEDHFVFIQQLETSYPSIVYPMSTKGFGLENPTQSPEVMITIEGISQRFSLTDFKTNAELSFRVGDTLLCANIKTLANGSRAIIIGNEIHENIGPGICFSTIFKCEGGTINLYRGEANHFGRFLVGKISLSDSGTSSKIFTLDSLEFEDLEDQYLMLRSPPTLTPFIRVIADYESKMENLTKLVDLSVLVQKIECQINGNSFDKLFSILNEIKFNIPQFQNQSLLHVSSMIIHSIEFSLLAPNFSTPFFIHSLFPTFTMSSVFCSCLTFEYLITQIYKLLITRIIKAVKKEGVSETVFTYPDGIFNSMTTTWVEPSSVLGKDITHSSMKDATAPIEFISTFKKPTSDVIRKVPISLENGSNKDLVILFSDDAKEVFKSSLSWKPFKKPQPNTRKMCLMGQITPGKHIASVLTLFQKVAKKAKLLAVFEVLNVSQFTPNLANSINPTLHSNVHQEATKFFAIAPDSCYLLDLETGKQSWHVPLTQIDKISIEGETLLIVLTPDKLKQVKAHEIHFIDSTLCETVQVFLKSQMAKMNTF